MAEGETHLESVIFLAVNVDSSPNLIGVTYNRRHTHIPSIPNVLTSRYFFFTKKITQKQ